MNNKILTLLGFAAKAGKLSFGMNASLTALKSKKSCLLVVAGDVSQKSRKEAEFFAHNSNVDIIILNCENIDSVSAAVGRKCGIISVNDQSFAEAIKGGYANDQ